jgi:hypothetical protein
VELRSPLEKGKAPDGLRGCATSILNPDIKVLARGLSNFDSNPAATVEMAARKAHISPHWGVLSVKIDIPRKWQQFATHSRFLGKRLLSRFPF